MKKADSVKKTDSQSSANSKDTGTIKKAGSVASLNSDASSVKSMDSDASEQSEQDPGAINAMLRLQTSPVMQLTARQDEVNRGKWDVDAKDRKKVVEEQRNKQELQRIYQMFVNELNDRNKEQTHMRDKNGIERAEMISIASKPEMDAGWGEFADKFKAITKKDMPPFDDKYGSWLSYFADPAKGADGQIEPLPAQLTPGCCEQPGARVEEFLEVRSPPRRTAHFTILAVAGVILLAGLACFSRLCLVHKDGYEALVDIDNRSEL